MKTIAIPPKTQQRLTDLVNTQQNVQNIINAILDTLRETLEVPDDYEVRDIRVGFIRLQPQAAASEETQG